MSRTIWSRRKPLEPERSEHGRLEPRLSWPHLIALGIGAIVGTGILTLIGVGAAKAGPAVIVSFVVAGCICACAALAYAEMATIMPTSGSAYSFSHAVLGEPLAWVVGWSLVLEYSLVASAVAVGWSGYAAPLLHETLGLPWWLMQGPEQGGLINAPAVFIVACVAALLLAGTRESASINAALVMVKIVALLVFVALAAPAIDTANYQPFAPFGFGKALSPDGGERGVMAAAAIIFFAFYGFDAIAAAAEDTIEPQRNLAIGILGSMVLCVLIYMAIAASAIGAVPFMHFANSSEPLALILRALGHPSAARFLGLSAVIALPTVILAFLFGQSRLFLALSRDGLLPRRLSGLSKRGTPFRITLFTSLVVGILAGLVPLGELAALANAGTLVAFAAVSICMMLLRRRLPELTRPFRAPAANATGLIATLGCGYLFLNLPSSTLLFFGLAQVLGLCIYWGYGRRRSTYAPK